MRRYEAYSFRERGEVKNMFLTRIVSLREPIGKSKPRLK